MLISRFPAEKEYARDPNLSRESVAILLDWVTKQPHLPNITEEDVILFLSSCIYSVEQAKQVIDIYFTFRTHVPEFFSNRDPLERNSAHALKIACIVPMPGLTDKGYKVFQCTLSNHNLFEFDFTSCIKAILYIMDLTLIEEGAHKGIQILFDMKLSTIGHLLRVNPLVLKKYLYYLQEAMPVRLKGIHFINPTSIMDALLALARPFLSKSTAENIHVHNNLHDLHKYIPKKMLTKNAGGDLPPIETLYGEYVKKLIANRYWLTSEEKLRVNESLRQGKAKSASELFGVEGSFKKLDID